MIHRVKGMTLLLQAEAHGNELPIIFQTFYLYGCIWRWKFLQNQNGSFVIMFMWIWNVWQVEFGD